MKFGLALDYLDPHVSPGETFDLVLELVNAARDAGFSAIYVGQHFLDKHFRRFHPMPLLARLAPESGEMLLVAADLVALNHPLRATEQLVSLDVLSGGRAAYLNVLGYRQAEFDAFGVSRAERGVRAREAYDIMSRLLLGESVDYDGQFFRADDLQLGLLRPTTTPRPPIWATAHGDKGIERAASHSDAWFISHQPTIDELRRQIPLYNSLRAERAPSPHYDFEDHGIQLPLLREAFVADTAAEAYELAAAPMMEGVKSYVETGQLDALNDPESYLAPFEEWRRGRALLGTADEVRDECREYAELGVDCIVLKINRAGIPFDRVLEAIEQVGETIIPAIGGKD